MHRWPGLAAAATITCSHSSPTSVRFATSAQDIEKISRIPADIVIVTAAADPEQPFDFVSRAFAPNLGIDEDPVTGSAHTVLAPFWGDRLGRAALVGLQASARSGLVGVELIGDRVIVSGRAVTMQDDLL